MSMASLTCVGVMRLMSRRLWGLRPSRLSRWLAASDPSMAATMSGDANMRISLS